MSRIQRIDNRILAFIQRRLRCPLLDFLMPIFSTIANFGVVWLAVAAAFIASQRYRRNGLTLLFVLALGTAVCNFGIKPYAARLRPCHSAPDFQLLVRRPPDYSFPSGHTMASFASALIIFSANPVFGIPAFVLAIIIAFSRMYLYVHYPSDVLAAALIGLLMPWSAVILLVRLHRRRAQKPNPNSTIV